MAEDVVRVGSVPAEAGMQGQLNEGPPNPQKEPARASEAKLAKGPKLDPKTKAYLPGNYKTVKGNIRTDR